MFTTASVHSVNNNAIPHQPEGVTGEINRPVTRSRSSVNEPETASKEANQGVPKNLSKSHTPSDDITKRKLGEREKLIDKQIKNGVLSTVVDGQTDPPHDGTDPVEDGISWLWMVRKMISQMMNLTVSRALGRTRHPDQKMKVLDHQLIRTSRHHLDLQGGEKGDRVRPHHPHDQKHQNKEKIQEMVETWLS